MSANTSTPIEEGSPTLEAPPDVAGGVTAVANALKYAVEKMGAVRSTATLLKLNQHEGFDCPSCAWPDPHERAAFEFCENGARAAADEATTRRVTPTFFAEWSIEDLKAQSDQWLNAQGRLTHPMVKRPGASHYQPIAWPELFRELGQHLRALPSPNQALFYTSGRTSNEAAFLYQLFVRRFGTNNMPDCSNMCHESSGTGLGETLGVGKGTVQLDDFTQADVILLIGQNPGTNHPRMLTTLREAKLRGCKIIAVNPLREAGLVSFSHPQKTRDVLLGGVALTDLYLQVQVGGDIALLKGIMKLLMQQEEQAPGTVVDAAFVREHTHGFEAFKADLQTHAMKDLCQQSGVSQEEMQAAASLIASSPKIIACWAMGITQHKHGVANVQEIVNLMLLRGAIGKPGAGVCPVRGHSNVQGDRTMGVWEKNPPWISALEKRFAFTAPKEEGHDTVGALEAMTKGAAHVFFAMGGNFLSATPDTEYSSKALSSCSVTAHVSTKLNRSHLACGETAYILPCLSRSERDLTPKGLQFVTVENSMSVVHASKGMLAPASELLLSEAQIVAGLAEATLGDGSIPWREFATDYHALRDAIAEVVPGFVDYNSKVAKPGGFVLPNAARERQFKTKTGKAHFTVHAVPNLTRDDSELWLTTIRSHDQFNTTVYELHDRYRGISGHRRVVLVSPVDMERMHLHEGDKVTLTSLFNGITRTAPSFSVVPYALPTGNVAAYFPEANVLIPWDSFADKSRTPTSKAIRVRLHKEFHERHS